MGADGLLLWGFRGVKGYMTAMCPRLMSQWFKVTQAEFRLYFFLNKYSFSETNRKGGLKCANYAYSYSMQQIKTNNKFYMKHRAISDILEEVYGTSRILKDLHCGIYREIYTYSYTLGIYAEFINTQMYIQVFINIYVHTYIRLLYVHVYIGKTLKAELLGAALRVL